jgi:hypothetical protein
MNRAILFVLTLISFSIISIYIYAQEADKEEIPPGMERLDLGAARVVVPIGTRVRKIGSLIILENDSEYMSRRFLEIQERIIELEAKEDELKKEVEGLKEALAEIQKEESPPEEE